jgi:hypothetical protein
LQVTINLNQLSARKVEVKQRNVLYGAHFLYIVAVSVAKQRRLTVSKQGAKSKGKGGFETRPYPFFALSY